MNKNIRMSIATSTLMSMTTERAMRTVMTMTTSMGTSMTTKRAMRIVMSTAMSMPTSMAMTTAMSMTTTMRIAAVAVTIMVRRMWRPVRTHILSRSITTPRAIPTTATVKSAIHI